MTLLILLFALGIMLLVIEVIVPGGIVGTLGALFMFGGCVVAFIEYGTAGGSLAVAVALGLTLLAFYIELRILPKTTAGKRAFLLTSVTGVSAAFGEEARALIGKPAEALTLLSPSGYVRVEGKRYEAFCQSGQVPTGTRLEVTGVDNFRLIVSLSTN